jgi:hypothetical protein
MREFAVWDDYFLAHPTPFKPEIALVLDETVAYGLSPSAAQNAPLSTTRKALGLVGAPYGQYLLRDVALDLCPAKVLVVILSQAFGSEQRRHALQSAMRGRTIIWVDEKGVTTAVLRVACRTARVHLYTQTDAVVFANGPLIAVHAVKDGPVTITPKRGGKAVTLSLRKGETRLLTT